MMKVLICSDTHRRHDHFYEVVEKEGPFDFLIHCGDTEGGEYAIREAIGCPSEIIQGNNEFFSELPKERIFELGGKKIWLTHGHEQCTFLGTKYIKQDAKEKGVNVVMFGHSHCPLIEEDDVLCINPGSLSYPRQANHRPSYIILNIDKDNKWDLEIKYC